LQSIQQQSNSAVDVSLLDLWSTLLDKHDKKRLEFYGRAVNNVDIVPLYVNLKLEETVASNKNLSSKMEIG
jgi:hypothetical protein